jgi:hypothetical protein
MAITRIAAGRFPPTCSGCGLREGAAARIEIARLRAPFTQIAE